MIHPIAFFDLADTIITLRSLTSPWTHCWGAGTISAGLNAKTDRRVLSCGKSASKPRKSPLDRRLRRLLTPR